MKKIIAYKPLPDDVLAYLRKHVEVVQVDAVFVRERRHKPRQRQP